MKPTITKHWTFYGNGNYANTEVFYNLYESGIVIDINEDPITIDVVGVQHKVAGRRNIDLTTTTEEQETLLLLSLGKQVFLKETKIDYDQ
jgi:hypothetical protein